jgi:hypothetical protein
MWEATFDLPSFGVEVQNLTTQDEFAVILPHSDSIAAQVVRQRILGQTSTARSGGAEISHGLTPINTFDSLTEKVLGAVFEVSNTLGAGFLEKMYRRSAH